MAEEANPPVSADTTNTVDEPTRSTDAVAEPAVAEAKPAEDGVVATSGVAEVPEDDSAQKDDAEKEDTTADAQAEPSAASDDAGKCSHASLRIPDLMNIANTSRLHSDTLF
jgi:outer membrane biosynthesis protein TonB